ncbi:Ext2 [Bugula neritina]|uniref:Ext2 n=1 Tax=Bugula neritina TaxID=10212 RepID=A0A7J7IYW5_BUGNE|nr:Ext2 [Bugula neritina]
MKQVLVNVAKASNVAKIIVIWNNPETNPPGDGHWPEVSVPVQVIHSKYNRLSNRFYPYDEIETDCVLSIDDDITMVTPAELDFGYRVWVENADRLVGFPPRYHSVNNFELKYVSEWISNISMVLTGVSFYHKYYHFLFTSALPDGIKDWIDGHMNCEDIAMNFLIANSTGKAPIKVLARKKFKSSATGLSSDMSSHLVARDICLRHFNEAFGQTILHSVEFRADPVLFKEQDLIDDMNLYYSDGAL